MNYPLSTLCVVFSGSIYIGSGTLGDVVHAAKKVFDADKLASLLIFDDLTSETIEIDFRGSADDVANRLKGDTLEAVQSETSAIPETPAGPGRPKLGVVAREVTLLPRHWEWLNGQPGGASVALRKLVEDAKRQNIEKDRIRQAQESCYRFMSTMAGDLPGFEEATRALFANDTRRFETQISAWPMDVRDHAITLAKRSWV